MVRAKELVEAQHASDERRRAAEARRRADAWLATVEDKRSRERRAPPIWTRRADELTAEELAVLERVSEEFDVRDALAAGETSEKRMACAAVGEYAYGRCNWQFVGALSPVACCVVKWAGCRLVYPGGVTANKLR